MTGLTPDDMRTALLLAPEMTDRRRDELVARFAAGRLSAPDLAELREQLGKAAESRGAGGNLAERLLMETIRRLLTPPGMEF